MITISNENIFKAIFGIEKANLHTPKDEPIIAIYPTTNSNSLAGLYLLNRYYSFQERNPCIGFKSSDLEAIKEQSTVDGNIECYYCKDQTPRNKITIDHFSPICFGGMNYFSNIRLSCMACNGMKGGIHHKEMPTAWSIFRKNIREGIKEGCLDILQKALFSPRMKKKEKNKVMILIRKEEEWDEYQKLRFEENQKSVRVA